MSFQPYLMFDGSCREAFTRYQEIFGGELHVLPMAEVPSDQPVSAEQAQLVAHAALQVGDGVLMASDDPTGGYEPPRGFCVSYSTTDLGEAKRVFDALAEGGTVTMPFGQTFWSPGFGMCTDRFGTPWMVGTENPDAMG